MTEDQSTKILPRHRDAIRQGAQDAAKQAISFGRENFARYQYHTWPGLA